VLTALRRYLANLSTGRTILWCYAIWYVVSVWNHFDPKPRLWLTSTGLSAIIGLALLLSTASANSARAKLDPWVVFRLFLMPFCVSSFAALVKDTGYVLIFPPTLRENLIGAGCIAAFLALVWIVKSLNVPARADASPTPAR
jgi:hypothetical protein